jgi:hypothetical protein
MMDRRKWRIEMMRYMMDRRSWRIGNRYSKMECNKRR